MQNKIFMKHKWTKSSSNIALYFEYFVHLFSFLFLLNIIRIHSHEEVESKTYHESIIAKVPSSWNLWNNRRCFLATDVPKMAVIPAKSLESGLNFKEADPRSARQTSRENQCSRRVAWQSKELKNLEWARVGFGGTKKKEKKKERLEGSSSLGARRARIMSIWTSDAVIKVLFSLSLSPFLSFQVKIPSTLFKHECKSVEVCGVAVCHRLVLQATLASCSDIILFGKKRFLVSRLRSELWIDLTNRCIIASGFIIMWKLWYILIGNTIERISRFSFASCFNLLDVDNTLIIINNW